MLILGGFILYFLSSQFLRHYFYRIVISNYIAVIGILLSLAALAQYVYGHLAAKYMPINAFFPNPNLFAGYLVIPFSFLLNKILIEKLQAAIEKPNYIRFSTPVKFALFILYLIFCGMPNRNYLRILFLYYLVPFDYCIDVIY